MFSSFKSASSLLFLLTSSGWCAAEHQTGVSIRMYCVLSLLNLIFAVVFAAVTSLMSHTRRAAADVAAPGNNSEGLLSESASNAAAAAKARHSSSLTQQLATQQQQPHMPAAQAVDADSAHVKAKQQVALTHQGSIDENALESESQDAVRAVAPKLSTGQDSRQLPQSSHASRTRSLPPKPKSTKTRLAKPVAAKAVNNAVPAEPALPVANPLSSTLAGLAQGLAASRNKSDNPSDAVEVVPEQIDLDCDFSSDSDDSDFQPDKEPAQAEDEVIDLSQEDPLDVVEQADGLVSIRSPPQAAPAAAAAAEASDDNDDEEEFQRLAGKRKQPAKAAAKGEKCSAVQRCFFIMRQMLCLDRVMPCCCKVNSKLLQLSLALHVGHENTGQICQLPLSRLPP